MNTQQVPLEEDLFYESVLHDYVQAPRFVPRPWLERLVKQAMGQADCRFVLLTAEPGAGKSAFVAQLAESHTDWPRYFIRRDQRTPLEDAGASAFLLKIGFQLAARFPEIFEPKQIEISVDQTVKTVKSRAKVIAAEVDKIVASPFYQRVIEIRQHVESSQGSVVGLRVGEWVTDPRLISLSNLQYMALFHPAQALRRLQPRQRIVILVDALDELRYRLTGDTLLDWLAECPKLPGNVRFLLTSRDDSELLKRFRGAQQPYLVERSIPTAGDEVLKDLDTYARALAEVPRVKKVLDAGDGVEAFVTMALEKSEGNIGYLDALGRAVDQAQASNDESLLASLLELSQLPKTMQGLYAFFLQQIKGGVKDDSVAVEDPKTLETHFLKVWPALYRRILGVLSVARQPLSPAQMRFLGGIQATTDDVVDALGKLRQFLDVLDGTYRFYHATLPEFLTADSTYQEAETQDIAVRPLDWHRRIVTCYRAAAPTWQEVPWQKMDDYGLRHLVAHLYALRGVDDDRKEFHSLLQDEKFADERLARWRDPNPLLGDLRMALILSLEEDDLAQVWLHLRRYRTIVSEEQTTQRVAEDVKAGDFNAALARTGLFGALPNSQALLRLWIAWKAASQGENKIAEDATRRALRQLPPRGIIMKRMSEIDPHAGAIGQDALSEALQRILVRVARAAETNEVSQAAWLRQVGAGWSESAIERASVMLSEPLDAWGEELESYDAQRSMDSLLDELQDRVVIDQPGNFREASYLYQRKLAAGLFANRHSGEWQDYVRSAVELISLDNYPSYREMALAWVATAVLAHLNEGEAQHAMSVVLAGALDQPIPDFWGDAAAVVLDGYVHESGKKLQIDKLLDVVEKLRPQVTIERRTIGPEDLAGRRPIDPWAFNMRQRSAVAAVLRRRKDGMRKAYKLLQEASQQVPWSSYAGYRVLARLSLACRWLEWGRLEEAQYQLKVAKEDAENMLDKVLAQERLELINAFAGWLANLKDQKKAENIEAGLRQARDLVGMPRSLYLQYLSGAWYPEAARLKTLLPLALDDGTAADAVLGRLLGALSLDAEKSVSFSKMVKVMELKKYTRRVAVSSLAGGKS